jgi:hypothetical protein
MATAKNTLSSLRATHDRRVVIPNKIRTALAAMAKSGDEWKYDEEFRKLAGVSPADLKEFRDDKEFKDLWAEMPATNGRRDVRRVWFATKKLADAWKAI